MAKERSTFSRHCRVCGKWYKPFGRWNYLCIDCLDERTRTNKSKLNKLKNEKENIVVRVHENKAKNPLRKL